MNRITARCFRRPYWRAEAYNGYGCICWKRDDLTDVVVLQAGSRCRVYQGENADVLSQAFDEAVSALGENAYRPPKCVHGAFRDFGTLNATFDSLDREYPPSKEVVAASRKVAAEEQANLLRALYLQSGLDPDAPIHFGIAEAPVPRADDDDFPF